MFGRATVLVLNNGNVNQNRGMATLKAISIRLKGVKSTQKITQSMKMVSAAKYAKAEKDLKQARPYGEGAKLFFEKLELEPSAEKSDKLLVAVTSDRGLCGAVHTQVSKGVRNEICESPDNTKVVCIGDKSRNILQRLFNKNIVMVANEVGRLPPTFLDAARIAQQVSQQEFSTGKILFNKFKSVVSYTMTEMPLFSKSAVMAAPKITVYDSLDDDVVQSYMEFSLASLLYYAMKEGACSEQSSRMTSMDNASKNAAEVIGQLTLKFNRTRQAVITGELIEIISGAAALND